MASQTRHSDVEAVQQAVLDYVEGAYEVDPARTQRSVHPSLAKLGLIWNAEAGEYAEHRMTFDELLEAVKTFNADGKIPPDAPKDVTVYEILDKTASAKVTAWWGSDYVLLTKFGAKWMITHILWQTPPRMDPGRNSENQEI